jgi:hypothetical protein
MTMILRQTAPTEALSSTAPYAFVFWCKINFSPDDKAPWRPFAAFNDQASMNNYRGYLHTLNMEYWLQDRNGVDHVTRRDTKVEPAENR